MVGTRLLSSMRQGHRAALRSPLWVRSSWRMRRRLWSITGRAPLVYLAHHTRNWGDALNRYLVARLAGDRNPYAIDLTHEWPWVPPTLPVPVHMLVGSVLQFADPRCVVWGAGLIAGDRPPSAAPAEIRAVRGPLTRKVLEDHGIACPPIYGDPALLLSRLYPKPRSAARFRLGLIPHYVDHGHPALSRFEADPECTVLDIKSATETLVDQVCECEAIASSSLHGLIVAQAYGIPSVWVRLSSALEGGDFKFQDYYASLGWREAAPVTLEDATRPSLLEAQAVVSDMALDLEELGRGCPLGEV